MTTPYLVLARKWRPRSFATLVGQEHVTRTLQNALREGRVPHAFLFTGIRGVGKTTLARLLAMCLNCDQGPTAEPCGQCGACLAVVAGNHPDVLEIDAASRTKVDQMREVLDMVRYLPTSSRYKVYILDEVHMLTTQSFNALLKTLEEPPAHVKFIFATTEVRKIPATILSRCQRHDLKRVTRERLGEHLRHILAQEGMSAEEDALAAVTRAADGSVRDALSLLDQVIAHGGGEVRFEAVKELLGLTDREAVLELLDVVLAGQGSELLERCRRFHEAGVEASALVNDLLDTVHQVTRQQVAPAEGALPRLTALAGRVSQEHLQMIYQVLLKGAQELKWAELPQQTLEMLLLRAAYLRPIPGLATLIQGLERGGGGQAAGGAPPRGVEPSRAARSSGQGAAAVSPPGQGVVPEPSPPRAVVERPPVRAAVVGAPVADAPAMEATSSRPEEAAPLSENLTSWEQLVSSADRRAPALALKLRQQVVCLDFQGGDAGPALVVQPLHECLVTPERLRRLLGEFLAGIGLAGARVTVRTPGQGDRPATIQEERERERRSHQEMVERQVLEMPVVRELVARFQAKVIIVEPVGAPPGPGAEGMGA